MNIKHEQIQELDQMVVSHLGHGHWATLQELIAVYSRQGVLLQQIDEGKQQWDRVAALLGVDGDNVDAVIRAATAMRKAEPTPQYSYGPNKKSPVIFINHEECMRYERNAKEVTDEMVDNAVMIHEGVRSIPKGGWGDKTRERMRAALEADRAAWVNLSDNDELMCCNGVDCGCQGITKGRYRAEMLAQGNGGVRDRAVANGVTDEIVDGAGGGV